MLAKCGTIESCDCLIQLYDGEGIDITSDVILQYGKQIEDLIIKVLEENNIDGIKVVINDKGALDYTIRARLLTALQRGGLL